MLWTKRIAILLVLLAFVCVGCAKKSEPSENAPIKVGVVGAIYDEIWAPAIKALAEQGIQIELVQFSDYVTPNNALNGGEIDLNTFQHNIYLNTEINNHGYAIQAIGYTFVSPLNMFSNKVTSVSEIADGDIIAIPNDVTNGGRALKVLQDAGLITLKSSAAFSPNIEDIEQYLVDISIVELAANSIPAALPDVTAGIINGNFALDFGLRANEAIFSDISINESQYWNLIAARTADVKDSARNETFRKIVDALQRPETEEVFNKNFGGYYIKAGWDVDLLK